MHDSRGELRVGHELAEQLLSLAQQLNEPALLLEAHHELWANLFNVGELNSARIHTERGSELYDTQKHRHHAFLYGGHDPGVCADYHGATLLWLLGYPDHAWRRSEDALARARELSHPSSMANSLFFASRIHQQRGEREAVQARIEEGALLAREHGFPRWLAQEAVMRGRLLVDGGQTEAGIAQMLKAIAADRSKMTSVPWAMYAAALLAEAYKNVGQNAAGLTVVDEALSTVQRTRCRYYEAELHRIKGELLLTQAAPGEEQAEACFREAIAVSRQQAAKSLELRAAMSLSRLWQRQGKTAEARQLLAEIYGWFTEGFDTADLKAAKALLEELA
jgi:adenylate cyclase